MRKMIVFTLALCLIISLVGCTSPTSSPDNTNPGATTTKPTTTAPTTTEKTKLSYGDMVKTGKFEFTLVKAEVEKVDNQFVSFDDTVLLYVTIKNTTDETQDIMFIFHPVFGPDGDEVESTMTSVYFDKSIDITAKIRSGNTLEGFYVCEYVGDGEYIMEVYELMGEPVDIYFDVKK